MKRRTSKLMLSGLLLMVTIGSGAQAPGQDPGTEGQWGAVLNWPFGVIHMIVLKNGKVLAFSGHVPTRCLLFDPDPGPTDPVIEEFTGPESPNAHRLYCSGHAALADGRIIFTGSIPLAETTTLYDPDVDPPGPASWIPQDNGSDGTIVIPRFYPTCTTLGDGTVLITAGRHLVINNVEANTPAIFDPTQPTGQNLQWRSLTVATYEDQYGVCDPPCNPSNNFHLDVYPFMYLLSTPSAGEVVFAGSDDAASDLLSSLGTRTLDPLSEAWTELIAEAQDPIRGGSAVLYGPNLIMKAGGRVTEFDPAIASVYTLDAAAPNPTWTQRPSMANARKEHFYLLVLPDGQILATNGGNDTGDVLVPELYDPFADPPDPGWQPMAAMTVARSHHATAVLLPDARVLVAGGSATAQIFSPPYLFQGTRPTITSACSAPDTMCYGGTASVMTPDANQVTAVSLIRPGSATHGTDFDQRFMNLNFTVEASDELSVSAPANGNEAPPGPYMLFIRKSSAVCNVRVG